VVQTQVDVGREDKRRLALGGAAHISQRQRLHREQVGGARNSYVERSRARALEQKKVCNPLFEVELRERTPHGGPDAGAAKEETMLEAAIAEALAAVLCDGSMDGRLVLHLVVIAPEQPLGGIAATHAIQQSGRRQPGAEDRDSPAGTPHG